MATDHLPAAIAASTSDHAGQIVTSILLRSVILLVALKTAIKVVGLWRTMQWIRHRVAQVPATNRLANDDLQAVEYSVAMAAAFYPGRAMCMEQSLVLYYVLRRRGVGVTLCQGVQTNPFTAHAWVEYDGAPLNDLFEHTKRFARFPNQLP
jgi:hypothetical protein